MKFELAQPGEFGNYYYDVYYDDEIVCSIEFFDDEWVLSELVNDMGVTITGLRKISNKIKELNAATKADKLFGFL